MKTKGNTAVESGAGYLIEVEVTDKKVIMVTNNKAIDWNIKSWQDVHELSHQLARIVQDWRDWEFAQLQAGAISAEERDAGARQAEREKEGTQPGYVVHIW